MNAENGKFINVYEIAIPGEIALDFEKMYSKIPNAKIRKIRSIPLGERVLDWGKELKELEGLVEKMQDFPKEEPEVSMKKYVSLANSLGRNGYHNRVNLPDRVLEVFGDSLEYYKQLAEPPYTNIKPRKAISYSTPKGTLSPRVMRTIAYTFDLGGEHKDIYELQRMEGLRNISMLISESVRRLAYGLLGKH